MSILTPQLNITALLARTANPDNATKPQPKTVAAVLQARALRAQYHHFNAAQQQDGVGPIDNTPPLKDSKSLVGSAQNPWQLPPNLVRSIESDINAGPTLPPPGPHVKLPTRQQTQAFIKRAAVLRSIFTVPGTAADALTPKKPTPTVPPSPTKPGQSERPTQPQPRPLTTKSAAANRKHPTTPKPFGVGLGGRTNLGRAATTALGTSALATSDVALPANTPPTPSSDTPASNTDNTNTPVTQATLDKDYAALTKTSAPQNNNIAVNWQSFFRLFFLENSAKTREMLAEALKEKQAANKIIVGSLELGRDVTAGDQAYNRLSSLQNTYDFLMQARKAYAQGPVSDMMPTNKQLRPEELDLRSGLENAQMQGAVQDVVRRNFINQVAGDAKGYNLPPLFDPPQETVAQYYKAHGLPDSNAQDAASMQSSYQHYNDRKEHADKKVMVSYQQYNGAEAAPTLVHLVRTYLSPPEVEGLSDADRHRYKEEIQQDFNVKRGHDWSGRVGVIQNEINVLRSAARSVPSIEISPSSSETLINKHNENEKIRTELNNRADALMPDLQGALDIFDAGMKMAAPIEGAFVDILRNRSALEDLRLQAKKDVSSLTAQKKALDASNPSPAEREALESKLTVFKQLKCNLDWRGTNMDDYIVRHMNATKDVRAARWHVGSISPIKFLQDTTKELELAKQQRQTQGPSEELDRKIRQHEYALARFGDEIASPYLINTIEKAEGLRAIRHKYPQITDFQSGAQAPQLNGLRNEFDTALQANRPDMQDVTATRVHQYIQDRIKAVTAGSPEMKEIQDIHAILVGTNFWRNAEKNGLVPRNTTAQKPTPFLAGPAKWAVEQQNKIKTIVNLRKEHGVTSAHKVPTEAPEEANTLSSAKFEPRWNTRGNTRGAPVDYNNEEEVNAYLDAKASAGAAVFGDISRGAARGAYKDTTYLNLDQTVSALQNFLQNASNNNVLLGPALNAIQDLVSSMQEAKDTFQSLVMQGIQRTEPLLLQMIINANQSINR